MNFLKIIGIFFIIISYSSNIFSQAIRGIVYDSENMPVPYAHVYVKNSGAGTITDEKGQFNLPLQQGNYEVIISSLGYNTVTIPIIIYGHELKKNITLETSSLELEQVVIKASRKDPAYDIIQNAIKAKKENYKQITTSKCDVYIKAKEIISEKEKKKREKLAEQEKLEKQQKDNESELKEPLAKVANKDLKMASNMNLVEIKLERQFQYPNNIKELRQAYECYGDKEGLFFLSTTEADFNFYHNLIYVEGLNNTPMISPLNATSILSYKFKLEQSYYEDGNQIFHIKVSPRKQGNATMEGYIDIIDSSFAIRKVDLSMEKGGLMFYDYFRIRQENILLNDSIWVNSRHEFDYKTKAGKRDFTGNTVAKYDNYNLDIEFPKRYFKNELSVTEKDAYKKDSTYWDEIRPEPLSTDERRVIFIKDSIDAAHNTKEYLDSLDRKYNRITAGDIFLWGIGYYNRAKKRHIWFGSIPSLINPFSVGGLRVGPNFLYFKRFENDKTFDIFAFSQIGIRNKDVKGSIKANYMYNPFKQSVFTIKTGKGFSVVQPYESFVGYMDRANYVESIYIIVDHSHEIFNGLYLDVSFSMRQNSPIDKYQFGDLNKDLLENNHPRSFTPYQIFESDIYIDYVLFQKYMTEPTRKVILGSDWPKISLHYKKGIPTIFGSDINFDFIEASIRQEFRISTLGTSIIKVASGKYMNTKSMTYETYKIFPRSDRWFFSTPMQNQLQDTTYITDDWFIEAHYVHSFNGAITNNIPFIRRLKIYETGGINYTWLKQDNFHYVDLYFGFERSFRIQRQLFKIGFFFVFGGSTNEFAKPTIQFSINHYDKSDGSWDK
ncbi:MAG: hypothetical protein A2033_09190 [Bacteroidetes bacterium GWA2_31_9]|nr:MAG: hypothetical protein A2033_09190 [Bacteroidetes bacterium GWA2_31_9]